MNLSTILTVLNAVPNVVARMPEFVSVINTAGAALKGGDQDVLKEALADAQEASDAAHKRLQAKLAAAAGN